jgi:outer membrane protein
MKKQFIPALLFLAFTIPVQSETLNLEKCIQLAMVNNPDVIKSEFTWTRSGIAVNQAWADLTPGASASASASNSGPVVSEMNESWNWSLGGSISQPFYTPGMYSRIGLARTRKTASGYSLASLKDQIRTSVENVYLQILTSDTLIGVYKANIRLADEQIDKMKQMVELGLKRQSDLLKSEVQRGVFQAQLVRETEALASSKRDLNLLMGRQPDLDFEIQPLQVEQIAIPDFETAFELMIKKNPQLKQLNTQIRTQELSLRIAKEAYLPSVSGSYSYSKRNDALSGSSTFESDQISVHLSIDLFDGFTKNRNVQLNHLSLEEARLDYASALRDAEEALMNQYRAIGTQNQLITIHQTNLASAREDLKVVSEQYAAGFSTILDLTDAQVSVFESETSLLQDLYARKRIEAEIRRLIGQ